MNKGVNMDRGPVMLTSDVSLPKDDKSASEVNKSQLGIDRIMKTPQCYSKKERKRLKSNGQYAKVSRPKSICIHLEISIQNILLVLSCDPTQSVNSKQQRTALKEVCVK